MPSESSIIHPMCRTSCTKLGQNPKITGIELPNSSEVKLSQFADDITLICKDTMSLCEICWFWVLWRYFRFKTKQQENKGYVNFNRFVEKQQN